MTSPAPFPARRAALPPPACSAVVGLQWGDEGKGKVVDLLSPRHDAVVRYNGGANAGHTVIVGGQRFAMHLVPSGILTPGAKAVIANGVVVDPEALLKELDGLTARGVDVSNLVLSDRAHVVMPYHKDEDAVRETILAGAPEDEMTAAGPRADRSIGTTRRGIGPAYADKVHRATAVRVGDLLRPEQLREKLDLIAALKGRTLPRISSQTPIDLHAHCDPARLFDLASGWSERLRPHIADTAYLLHDMLHEGKRLLFEGANATLLDIDHGTFPYVTSSSCSTLGIGPGTGVPDRSLARVVGVMKAYSTRVGAGPFPTELKDDIGSRIRERGREYGTTTGRPRRCGWLDLVAVRYSAMLNGVTSLAVMLLDVLAGFDELRVCTAYRVDGQLTERFLPDAVSLARAEPVYITLPGFPEQITEAKSRAALPPNARAYLDLIERHIGLPVHLVSVGPDREQTIVESALQG